MSMSVDRAVFLTGLASLAAAALPRPAGAATALEPVPPYAGSPADSLARLEAGNRRFWTGHPTRPPYQTPDARPQKPFAALLVCADSRVGPELVFDQGLGSLFVCRVAGNTADDEITGSLEYAVEHLHAPLVAVIGHSGCGACSETLNTLESGLLPPASVAAVVRAILPATHLLPSGLAPDQRLKALIAANARLTAGTLAMSPVLHALSAAGRLGIVWGVHDLASGQVHFSHPAG